VLRTALESVCAARTCLCWRASASAASVAPRVCCHSCAQGVCGVRGQTFGALAVMMLPNKSVVRPNISLATTSNDVTDHTRRTHRCRAVCKHVRVGECDVGDSSVSVLVLPLRVMQLRCCLLLSRASLIHSSWHTWPHSLPTALCPPSSNRGLLNRVCCTWVCNSLACSRMHSYARAHTYQLTQPQHPRSQNTHSQRHTLCSRRGQGATARAQDHPGDTMRGLPCNVCRAK
jgi:hypothetical protein